MHERRDRLAAHALMGLASSLSESAVMQLATGHADGFHLGRAAVVLAEATEFALQAVEAGRCKDSTAVDLEMEKRL